MACAPSAAHEADRNISTPCEFAIKYQNEPQGVKVKTRSVEELRRESEQSRAELAATVDRLREQIADTAEDIRHKVSPENIKTEVTGFIRHKTHGWLDTLKQQAMDNPMQAIAAGAAVAVPALRLARGVPLPLLMVGAGFALNSKTVRDRAAAVVAPTLDKASEFIDEAGERAQSLGDGMRKAMSHAEHQATDMAGETREYAGELADAANGIASDLKDRATQAAETVASNVRSGMDAASEIAKERMERIRSTATSAPANAGKGPRRRHWSDPCRFPSEHHGRSPRGRQSQWPDQTLGECRSSVRIRGREGHRFVGGGCCCQKRLCGRPWRTRQPYH